MKIRPHVSGVLMIKKDLKVEEAGIEPATCRMRSDHSTPELHPRLDMLQSIAIFYYNILFLGYSSTKFTCCDLFLRTNA